MVIYLTPNVIKMYACSEGGGQWSWRELECTPYDDLVALNSVDKYPPRQVHLPIVPYQV